MLEVHACNLSYLGDLRSSESWLQVNEEKILWEPILIEKAGHGGVFVIPLMVESLKLEDHSLGPSTQKVKTYLKNSQHKRD
jgi:hypothetical protein